MIFPFKTNILAFWEKETISQLNSYNIAKLNHSIKLKINFNFESLPKTSQRSHQMEHKVQNPVI